MRKGLFLALLMVCLMLLGCGATQKQKTAEEKLLVAASFYPMAEFTQAVGGDRVQVWTMIPDGVEPHDWEPSPRILTKLGRAKLLVYNGRVEPWAEQALTALSERKLKAVEAGKGLYNCQGKADPHVWISPKKASLQVKAITEALGQLDPAGEAVYKENSRRYQLELAKLDQELQGLAKEARVKYFVTAHAAFGHLAEDYGLKQIAIRGLSPEAEPTAETLKEAALLVKKHQLKYIFFETLTSPKITQVLAKETGAEVLVLDPIEGLDEAGRKENLTYIKIMERNISNLKKALKE